MSIGTAITIFAKTVVKEGRIPFELSVKTPNHETIEAMLEAEKLSREPKTKRYSNFIEAFDEVMAEYSLVLSNRFKKYLKQCVKCNFDIAKMNVVVETLPEKYQDHSLTWTGHRECHIQPDWLLVYHIEDDVLVLTHTRTGTHSDLF